MNVVQRKLPTSAWIAVLAALAGVAVVVGVLARDSGPQPQSIPAEVSNPGGVVTEPSAATGDPGTVVTPDTGITIADPDLRPACIGVPRQGVTMTFGGRRYVLAGLGCEDPATAGEVTVLGETDDSGTGSPVQQVYQLADGTVYTQDPADGSWNVWAASGE